MIEPTHMKILQWSETARFRIWLSEQRFQGASSRRAESYG